MDSQGIQGIAFQIILHSGDDRTLLHEAMTAMRKEDFDLADEKMHAAHAALIEAHKSQTNLLTEYANGTKIEMEVILVHAQDHLMTTTTLEETAIELEYVHKKLSEISKH